MKKTRVTDVIKKEDVEKWGPDQLVIITAGTGVGKSYFVKNTLYEHAKNNGEKILMLIHRKLCVDQFRMEIEEDKKDDVIEIMTYQKLEYGELHGIDAGLGQFKYIVSDEFHYFISDARFNNTTDISFKKIMSMKKSIRIFMSATGEDIKKYIQKDIGIRILDYRIPFDWSFIASLNFYCNDKSLKEFAKKVVKSGKKGIFFIQEASKAYKLYKEFKDNALFNCSKYNNEYHKYVCDDKIDKLLKDQKFEENILITTSCMDAGVNIIDPLVRYIIIDIKDIGSLIQCMGRKRIQSDDDKIDVFIKVINNRQLGGLETNARKQKQMADYLKDHTTEEWMKEYPRQFDKTQTVYEERINDGNVDTCTKKVNELMYQKKQSDIEEICHIKGFGKMGYCKYIARRLDRYDMDLEVYRYNIISEDFGLENYLSSHVGQVMLQTKDREELINAMNVCRDGHLKKSLDILNAALKEDGLPYKIEKFMTHRIINGKVKKFKSAWRIISFDWDNG